MATIPPHGTGSPENGEARQVGLSVIGVETPNKTLELAGLCKGILTQLKLDPSEEANITLVRGIVYDCVRRGLGDRAQLGDEERISPMFMEGLSQRIRLKERYKALVEENTPYSIVSPAESDATQLLNISPDFARIDHNLPLLEGRFAAVEAFQSALFSLPQLEGQANLLRPLISVEEPDLTPRQESLLANNRLFANLIAVVALQRSGNLAIQPTDMIDFRDMWNDTAIRIGMTRRILAFMQRAADNLGIPQEHVVSYTEAMLDEISVYFASHSEALTHAGLRESPFVFATAEQMTIRREFTSTELKDARQAYDKLQAATHRRKGDRAGMIMIHDVENLSPLEVYFILQRFRESGDKLDMTGFWAGLPIETSIAALDILQASQYREQGTGQEIAEFGSQSRAFVYDKLKIEVINSLGKRDGKYPDETFKLLQTLPIPVLFEYLGVKQDHQAEIYALGDARWVQIAQLAHISVNEFNEFVYPPGTNLYEDYFTSMPSDMSQRVKNALRVVIE